MNARQFSKEIHKLIDPAYLKQSQYYFKTGEGEYSEHDIFLGIRVPKLRLLSKRYKEMKMEASLSEA